MKSHRMFRRTLTAGLLGGAILLAGGAARQALRAEEPDAAVLAAENERIAVVEKVKPSVVAVMTGGGSGVLIDPEGYALTNFHVTDAARSPFMKCGLPDGVLYDAVLVGQDKVGDVALIKLLPKKPGDKFPFATLGDSDQLKAGDWSLAMGNPFLLATDFTPTVTYGLVSGINRYQYPAGSLLEYTDCIQIDTSINPGNSGGPLFNMKGELVGINGRGSFEKRGRVNSGVGYAISINQIKNFLGHLRAGLDTDHATLGATAETTGDDLAILTVKQILEDADVARRGLAEGDELVSFAGRQLSSVNQYKNVLGLYPKGWRMPLSYRHNNDKKEVLVRLMGLLPTPIDPKKPDGTPVPKPGPAPKPPAADNPAVKLYKAKKGFANYYFNEQMQDRLLAALKKNQGDFAAANGDWAIDGQATLQQDKGALRDFHAKIAERKADDGKSTKTVLALEVGNFKWDLEPLKEKQEIKDLMEPAGSNGFLMALYHYHRLLTMGRKGFEKDGFTHGGYEPFYPPPADGSKPKNLRSLRVDAEVLLTEYASVSAKWYFALKDQTLLGFEVSVTRDEDPCEVYLSDYKPAGGGRSLPHRIEVRRGYELYGTFTLRNATLAAAK